MHSPRRVKTGRDAIREYRRKKNESVSFSNDMDSSTIQDNNKSSIIDSYRYQNQQLASNRSLYSRQSGTSKVSAEKAAATIKKITKILTTPIKMVIPDVDKGMDSVQQRLIHLRNHIPATEKLKTIEYMKLISSK